MNAESDTSKKPAMIAAVVLVAAVIVAVIVALSAGGDNEVASDATSADSRIPAQVEAHVSPVQIVGDPLPRLAPGVADPAVGMAAPVFTASYYDDTEVTVNPADGNPRIIMFLTHW